MKPKDKILTYEQARELKWFCENVTGTRMELYENIKQMDEFKIKIDRLQQTADMILKWCEDNNVMMFGEEPTPKGSEK